MIWMGDGGMVVGRVRTWRWVGLEVGDDYLRGRRGGG